MRRIAVVSPGYLYFPCEGGMGRIFDLCVALSSAGFIVDAFIPDFYHPGKCKRDIELIKSQNYPINIVEVHTPPYSKNISFKRIYSNKELAFNIKQALAKKIGEIDVVFCSIAPNDVGAEVAKVCKMAGVPMVVDIEDLWPEAMAMVLKNDSLRNFLLKGFIRDAEYVYRNCSAAIGTSPDYTARATKHGKRDIPYETVYVGVDLLDFDKGAKSNIPDVAKPEGEFWVTYSGSVSNSYDIINLVKAMEIIENTGHTDIKCKIMGTGTKVSEIQEYISSKNIANVELMGFTKYDYMSAVLCKSDVLVNSFAKGAPQSIVNKVGDYLAAGRPMINTLENHIFTDIVDENRIGVNVEAGNPGSLCNAILNIYKNPENASKMGLRARKLCESEFDRRVCNKKVIDIIESLFP